jgi:hypothetical protein
VSHSLTGVKLIALTLAERAVLLAALEDPPAVEDLVIPGRKAESSGTAWGVCTYGSSGMRRAPRKTPFAVTRRSTAQQRR